MMGRLEAERRQAGRAVIEAQERERERIARDLHDEVNQSLTAVSLRLQASIEQAPATLRAELLETKRLAGQAMEELLDIARRLRPAVLDDHGLLPALASQVRQFARPDRHRRQLRPLAGPRRSSVPSSNSSSIGSPRRACPTSPSTRAPSRVHVSLSFNGEIRLVISDDGRRVRRRPSRRARADRHARARAAGRGLVQRAVGARVGNACGACARMRILVADDHGIVRAGIRLLLERQAGMEVVAEAQDGVEAVAMALAQRPDLCILDVSMPRLTGLQAAREIRAQIPGARVLMLSMHDDERYLFEALKAGAQATCSSARPTWTSSRPSTPCSAGRRS